jgi:hypothetical protein
MGLNSINYYNPTNDPLIKILHPFCQCVYGTVQWYQCVLCVLLFTFLPVQFLIF